MQVTLGLPEPREFSSLPRLRLVQMGISTHTLNSLPMTPMILLRIKILWSIKAADYDVIMLWAAVCLCFFGFFHSGEITIPSGWAFDSKIHLSWGDIAVDDVSNPSALRIHLKRSKVDQFGKVVQVYVGKTNDDLCPVAAVLVYIAVRGSGEGPISSFR